MQTPFYEIPEIPETESATNSIARFIDGLGFRYRWATEGLTENEFNFRPQESSMNMQELIEHIHSLADVANRTFGGSKRRTRSLENFMEIRNETIEIYLDLSNHLKEMNDEDLKNCNLDTRAYGTFPFWNLLNGPVADALTHVGQITSWRRIAGNPQMKGVNPFIGKKS